MFRLEFGLSSSLDRSFFANVALLSMDVVEEEPLTLLQILGESRLLAHMHHPTDRVYRPAKLDMRLLHTIRQRPAVAQQV